ncbi:MAG: hypothetical protein JXA78_08355 [Anaerolineales bacterium]|nr:hypothetical protein [Anaerolineales bacterium]
MANSSIKHLLLAILVLALAACCAPVPTPSPAHSATPSQAATISPTPSAAPTATPTYTPTPTPTFTPSPTPTPLLPAGRIAGIEVEAISPGALDWLQGANAYWTRRNALLWSQVEPQEGLRNWEALAGLERELIDAAGQGLLVILVVRSTPAWAQKIPGYPCGPAHPDKLDAFASFLHDAVARYSQPPYNVKLWEIGNEPDVDPSLAPPEFPFGCWGDQDDPYYGGAYYAETLRQVYPQIKAADPWSQVLLGGLALDCDPLNPPLWQDCTPSRYLEGILMNGGGEFFDILSFHNYDLYTAPFKYENRNWRSSSEQTGPVVIAKTRYLRGLLAAYGYGDKFLMSTETGLLCGRDGRESYCQAEAFQLTKASYAAQSNASALAEGLQANIWYSLSGWRGTDLIEAGQALPVYEALRFSASQLNGAAFVRPVDIYAGVMGYEFARDGKRLWVLWSLDGQEHDIQLFTQPVAVYDVFGAELPAVQELAVTAAPVTIEWVSFSEGDLEKSG